MIIFEICLVFEHSYNILSIVFFLILPGFLCYITHSSSLRRLACEATARVLHLAQSATSLGAMLRLSPVILWSFSTVHRHVSFGCPIFLLPRGVHLRAILVMELESMWQMPPPLCLYNFCQCPFLLCFSALHLRWHWASKS